MSDTQPFDPLDRVTDSHSNGTDPSEAVVLGCIPDSTIAEETVGDTGKAVADFAGNEEYPRDDTPVQVVFAEALDWEFGDRWRDWDHETLWTHAQRPNFPTVYTYPSERLRPADTEADP